jgi:sulfur-oxidizing protein SoxB
MVRCGGLGYSIDVSKPAGRRISGMTLLKTGKPIDPAKDYTVAGWASVNEGTQGPPVWELVERHIARAKSVEVTPNRSVKISGV